jgi:hypothetical protein
MAVMASSGARKVEDEMMRDAFLSRHQQKHVELAEELEHRRSQTRRGEQLTAIA